MKNLIFITLMIALNLYAHPGRTDSNGGHYNRSTGEYHYHNSGYTKTKYSSSKKASFTCGTKRYCKQMTSCKEAYYYYKECGLGRLDGDKDGIPCENLCR